MKNVIFFVFALIFSFPIYAESLSSLIVDTKWKMELRDAETGRPSGRVGYIEFCEDGKYIDTTIWPDKRTITYIGEYKITGSKIKIRYLYSTSTLNPIDDSKKKWFEMEVIKIQDDKLYMVDLRMPKDLLIYDLVRFSTKPLP